LRSIGQLGGKALAEKGIDFRELGSHGGLKTAAKYGREHMIGIGRKGGQGNRGKAKPFIRNETGGQ